MAEDKKSGKKENPTVPTASFSVGEGSEKKTYKFIKPQFILAGVKHLSSEAIKKQDVLDELVKLEGNTIVKEA